MNSGMLYLALAFVLILLGLLSFAEWRKSRTLSADIARRLLRCTSEHLSLGQWEEAEKLLKKMRRRGRSDEETTTLWVQLLRRTKRWDEAMAALDAAAQADRTSLLLLRERAKVLLATEKPEQALETFERCRPVLRDEQDLYDLAKALYLCGKALPAWEVLLPLVHDSRNGKLLALAGDCCFARKQFEQALTLYEQAGRADHDNIRILARRGHCLRRLVRFAEAEHCFTAILRKDPKCISATLSLGACLEAQGQYTKALMVYQHGDAWTSGDMRIFRQAGICAVHTNRCRFAELYLREAISRGGTSEQVLALLGYSLERQGKWSEAQAVYLRMTKRYPKHVSGYRGLAWLYGVGLSVNLDAAIGLHAARKSLEILPDLSAWEALSACQARAGNFIEAHSIQEGLVHQESDENLVARALVA
jgi:tetratricopeptide (TPR) repeat protein